MKILVIEDTEKHIREAKDFFKNKQDTNLVFAKTFEDAERHLVKGQVDGVISDIFFPLRKSPPWSQEEPIGVAVMILCRERNIPCILNTAGYHHGSRYQWICELQQELHLPGIIDASGDSYAEADTKNWEGAYNALCEISK